jgi:hypothetical protein
VPREPLVFKLRLDALLQASKAVSMWMGRDPQKPEFYIFETYLRWRSGRGLPNDPDQWIEECLQGNNLTLVKHLKTLLEWAEGPALDGLSPRSKLRYYHTIRAFYKRNFVGLPPADLRTRREAASSIQEPVTATAFSKMFKLVLERGRLSTRDRSIMLTMLQGGMDDSTLALSFNFAGFPQLVRHFDSPDPAKWDEAKVPVKIDLIRPKTDYRYYTFLHRDAIAGLKAYLSSRGVPRSRQANDPRRMPTSEPIYLAQLGKEMPDGERPISPEAVSVIYNEAGKRAGVNVRPAGAKLDHRSGASIRYPFHGHEVRDHLVTIARGLDVPEAVANFFIGHNIDVHGYDKSPWDDPEHFRDQYRKLSRRLNIVTGELEAKDEEIERLEGEQAQKMQEQRLELLEAKQHIKEMESDYKKVLERMDALERVRELKSGE